MEMATKTERPIADKDAEDLKLIRKMKCFADKGYDVELRKDGKDHYKVMRVDKKIIAAE